MRHKYDTAGIVLARTPLGEANTLVTILTPTVGLVRARAQGLRKPGAKLASALVTLAKSDLVLVLGKEGWRIAGAVLDTEWQGKDLSYEARARAARVLGLITRLMGGDANDESMFSLVESFLRALATLREDQHEPAELLVVLRTMSLLGLDAGEIPGEIDDFTEASLDAAITNKIGYVQRINHGITASGL